MVRGTAQPAPTEVLLGVRLRELDHGAALPALGRAHADRLAADRGQPRREPLEVAGGRVDDQLPGRRVLGVVEVAQEPVHQLVGREVLHEVGAERLATDHAAPAQHQVHHARLQPVGRDAHRVQVVVVREQHLLGVRGALDVGERVAEPRGRLVLLRLRRGRHARGEIAREERGVPGEEPQDPLDVLVVGRVVHPPHAGRRAPAEIRQQARPAEAVVPGELRVAAGPDGEGRKEQVERVAQRVGAAEGAEVPDTAPAPPAVDGRPRPLLPEVDRQVGVALVVLQPDVVAGLVRLDQGVLEQERVHVAGGHRPVDVGCHLDELGRPFGEPERVPEVVGEARAQRARLPDVERGPGGVPEDVDTWPVGDRRRLRPVPHAPDRGTTLGRGPSA